MAVLLSDLLHLQPLSPSHCSDCLYCLASMGLNCRPSLPPTVSLAHTLHSSQIAVLVLTLKPPLSLILQRLTALPHGLCLLKASPLLKAQLRGHHILEYFFDELTVKGALGPFLLRTCWLTFAYWEMCVGLVSWITTVVYSHFGSSKCQGTCLAPKPLLARGLNQFRESLAQATFWNEGSETEWATEWLLWWLRWHVS